MKIIAYLAAAAGALVGAADFFSRLKGGFRVGYEQSVELLLLALVVGVMQLWRDGEAK